MDPSLEGEQWICDGRDERDAERSCRVRRRSRLGARRVSAMRGVPAQRAGGRESTHGGERLVDRKRLMRNPRVRIYRKFGTLGFQINVLCFGSRPERVGCKNRKPGRIVTDRTATGAGQFVLSGKNGRSSRLRSFGPPLREER